MKTFHKIVAYANKQNTAKHIKAVIVSIELTIHMNHRGMPCYCGCW